MEKQAERCLHLKYNFVELPDGAMSSRKGNIVPITDLIEQMKAHVKSTYLSRYENDWAPQDIEETSDMVAQGAIKYGMNSMDMNKKIVFKMEDWLKLDGESGPYIQYTHARINSLLEKNPVDKSVAFKGEYFKEPIELELLLKLAQFNRIVESCAQNLRTAPLCTYVYELAKVFNSFYHDCPIGKLEDLEHRKARLELSRATKEVLAVGLGLLAIPAPQKM
jgi:arginyl-tRNA synthetase